MAHSASSGHRGWLSGAAVVSARSRAGAGDGSWLPAATAGRDPRAAGPDRDEFDGDAMTADAIGACGGTPAAAWSGAVGGHEALRRSEPTGLEAADGPLLLHVEDHGARRTVQQEGDDAVVAG